MRRSNEDGSIKKRDEGVSELDSASSTPGDLASSANLEPRLRVLFDSHYASIWRLLRRFGLKDEVDDATQEVFWIAARKLADIRAGSEHSFLYGVAIRVAARARSARGSNARTNDEALDSIAADDRPADDVVDENRARALLDRVVRAMPDDLREVFVLFELEEIEIPEIAEIVGIPVGTVGSRLRRARESFSEIAKRLRAQTDFRGGSR